MREQYRSMKRGSDERRAGGRTPGPSRPLVPARQVRRRAAALVALVGAACQPGVVSAPPTCLPVGCESLGTCDDPECNLDKDADGVKPPLDCDDHAFNVSPERPELCGDAIDQNCDGSLICDGGTDDADSDTYGSLASGGSDCDDGDPAIHPGAPERCGDAIDQDCDDSLICDGGTEDADGDSYGSLASGGSDCDDADPDSYPGAPEVCGDEIDQDCDGSLTCDGGTEDADSDTYGSLASGGSDCDDHDAAVYPGAPELCGDRIDQDCDGSLVCDGGSLDADDDGYASLASGGSDCDDQDATSHPGAADPCGDGRDQSCGTAVSCADQWTSLALPGGAITAFAAAPPDVAAQPESVLALAGDAHGRVWRSRSGGRAWQPAAVDLGSTVAVSALTFHPDDPQRVYLARAQGPASAQASVWRSLDGGSSWIAAGAGLPDAGGGAVTALALDPTAPAVLYAAVPSAGLYRSADEGGSWSLVGAGQVGPSVRGVALTAAGVALASTLAEVRRSTDGGQTWPQVLSLPSGAVVHTRLVATPQACYLLVTYGDLWRSSDDGASWERLGLPGGAQLPTGLAALPAGGGPGAPARLWLATLDAGLFHSVDGALSWSAWSTGASPHVLALSVGAQGLFVGLDGAGVTRAAVDPASGVVGPLLPANHGLRALEVTDLVVAGPRRWLVGSWGNGAWQTSDGGASWQRVPVADCWYVERLVAQGERLVLACGEHSQQQTQALWYSADGGATFEEISTPLLDGSVTGLAIADSLQTRVLVAATGSYPVTPGSLLQWSGGAGWADAADGLTDFWGGALAWDGGSWGLADYRGRIQRAAPGAAWDALTDAPAPAQPVALAIDAADPRRWFVGLWNTGGQGGVYRTLDGSSWGLPAPGAAWGGRPTDLRGLLLDPHDGARLLVIGAQGVAVTAADGGSWQALARPQVGADGMTDLSCLALGAEADAPLLVGTAGRGLWATRLQR